MQRREQLYRAGRTSPVIAGRIVILVDDGIATGSTMRAAIAALKKQQPARLVVAVPVAPPSTVSELQAEGTQVVCIQAVEPFGAIGAWYEDFRQVSDEQVIELLAAVAERQSALPA